MSVNGIGGGGYSAAWYNNRSAAERVQKNMAGQNFPAQMSTTQSSQMSGGAFVLHYFDNEEGDRAVTASCGSDHSVTVYEPKDFDPANPVYKVRVWDKDGNMTERMVDIAKVDPKNSDYMDMYAYSSYMEEKGGCKGALSSFMGSGMTAYGMENERSYHDLFDKKNWVSAVREMMQMQYDAKNLQGYLEYKKFYDFLKGSQDASSSEPAQQMYNLPDAAENEKDAEKSQGQKDGKESKSDTEIITRPDGSKVLLVKTQVGGMETMMSIALSKPAPLQDEQEEVPADKQMTEAEITDV